MNITLSKSAGFCPGVKRADITIGRLIRERGEKEDIYILGELIHNNVYNEYLKNNGVISLNEDEIEEKAKVKEIIREQPERFIELANIIRKENEQWQSTSQQLHTGQPIP